MNQIQHLNIWQLILLLFFIVMLVVNSMRHGIERRLLIAIFCIAMMLVVLQT